MISFFRFLSAFTSVEAFGGELCEENIFVWEWPMLLANKASAGYLTEADVLSVPVLIRPFGFNQGSSTVTDQLNCGARALELNLLVLGNDDIVFHRGGFQIDEPFEDVLQEVLDWAATAENELIFLYLNDLRSFTPRTIQLVRDALQAKGIFVAEDCEAVQAASVADAFNVGLVTADVSVIALSPFCVERYDDVFSDSRCYVGVDEGVGPSAGLDARQMLLEKFSDAETSEDRRVLRKERSSDAETSEVICGDALCQSFNPGSYCKFYQLGPGRVCQALPGVPSPSPFCPCPGDRPDPLLCEKNFGEGVSDALSGLLTLEEISELSDEVEAAGCGPWVIDLLREDSCACYESSFTPATCPSPSVFLSQLEGAISTAQALGPPSLSDIQAGQKGPLFLTQGHWQYPVKDLSRGGSLSGGVVSDSDATNLNSHLSGAVDFGGLSLFAADNVCSGGSDLLAAIQAEQAALCAERTPPR